jgi:hypothetical protein
LPDPLAMRNASARQSDSSEQAEAANAQSLATIATVNGRRSQRILLKSLS